jgi:hypothetical protein
MYCFRKATISQFLLSVAVRQSNMVTISTQDIKKKTYGTCVQQTAFVPLTGDISARRRCVAVALRLMLAFAA